MKCRGGIEAFRPSKYEGSGGKQSRCGFNDFAGCDWLLGTSRRNRLLVPRLTSWRHTLSSRPSTLARRPGICTYTSRFSFGHAEQKEALQEVTHPLFGSDLWKRSWGPPTSAGLRVSQTTHNGPHRRQIFVLSYFFFFSFFSYVLLATVIRQATYRPHSSCGLVVYKAFIRSVCATSLLACTTHYTYIPKVIPSWSTSQSLREATPPSLRLISSTRTQTF